MMRGGKALVMVPKLLLERLGNRFPL